MNRFYKCVLSQPQTPSQCWKAWRRTWAFLCLQFWQKTRRSRMSWLLNHSPGDLYVLSDNDNLLISSTWSQLENYILVLQGNKRQAVEDLASFTSSHPCSNTSEKRSLPLRARYGINAWKRWALSFIDKSEDTKVKDHTKPSKLNPLTWQQCVIVQFCDGDTNCMFSNHSWHLFPSSAVRPKSNLLSLSSEELNVALSQFIKEVCRPNGERYSPDSLLYLCLGIQQVGTEKMKICPAGVFFQVFRRKFAENA